MELENPHDLPKGPGLFSGKDGAFTLYASDCKPSKIEEVAEDVKSLDTPAEEKPAPTPIQKPVAIEKPAPVEGTDTVEPLDGERTPPIVKTTSAKKSAKKTIKKPQKIAKGKKAKKKKKNP